MYACYSPHTCKHTLSLCISVSVVVRGVPLLLTSGQRRACNAGRKDRQGGLGDGGEWLGGQDLFDNSQLSGEGPSVGTKGGAGFNLAWVCSPTQTSPYPQPPPQPPLPSSTARMPSQRVWLASDAGSPSKVPFSPPSTSLRHPCSHLYKDNNP